MSDREQLAALGIALQQPTREQTGFENDVWATLDAIGKMLIAKNKAYGDSALNPVRIFSKADKLEQLRVRLDDKLSRIARGQAENEDAVQDAAGYLILLMIAQGRRV